MCITKKCNEVATFSKIFQKDTASVEVFFKIFMLAAHSALYTENPPLLVMLQTIQKVENKSPKTRN